MRIAVVIDSIKPDIGGGFTFQHEIYTALKELYVRSRHEFVLFYNGVPKSITGNSLSYLKKNSIFDLIVKKLWSSSFFLYLINKFNLIPLDKKIASYKIDMVWFLSPNSFRAVEVPYISTVWDLQHRLQPWFPELSAKGEWISRESYFSKMLQRATYIITGNQAGKREIVRFYQIPEERIKLLPHPTPSFASETEAPNSLSVLERNHIKPGYVFYPAQFWPHKNHYILLKALIYLRDEYQIKTTLVLTGSDQGNRSYIEKLVAEYRLQEQVFFLGFVPAADLKTLYKNALALTYSSYCGPENLPPLEAFAIGCPVIAAKWSGAEEQLGDAAILFNPKDHIQLATAIRSLAVNSNLRADLVSRGKLRASKWAPKDFVAGIFSILDEYEDVRKCWP